MTLPQVLLHLDAVAREEARAFKRALLAARGGMVTGEALRKLLDNLPD